MIRIQSATPPGFALCRRFCGTNSRSEIGAFQDLGSELRGLFATLKTLELYPDARHDPQQSLGRHVRLKEPTNG